MATVQQAAAAITDEIERVVFGKRSAILDVLTCLFAGGHLLVEDVPGTAKTLLARALARAIGGEFSRLQCTPDLLPAEVTGSSVYRPDLQQFVFHNGPVFANVLLVDEVNRATPRTQSALLEAMAEAQVSADGETRALPSPFFVIATQNPIEHEGTFPLPEAQLDRFLMRISIGYPPREAEERMLAGDAAASLAQVRTLLAPAHLAAFQQLVRQVAVHPDVRTYIIDLAEVTRGGEQFSMGAGPRATLGLLHASQARAAILGRSYVLPDDVKALHSAVFAHRVKLSPMARLDRMTPTRAVSESALLVTAPAPRVGVAAHAPVAAPAPRGDIPTSDERELISHNLHGAAPGAPPAPRAPLKLS